jgi:hypothetical protein
MRIFTYATHSEGTFPDLAQHPMVVVLGYGTPWRGYLHRTRVVLNALDALPEDEVVVLVDAFDTVIKRTAGLLEAFGAFDCAVLVSNEGRSGFSNLVPPALFTYLQRRIFGTCKGGRTASCGLLMGYVGALRPVLERMAAGASKDDQRNLNALCPDFPALRVDEDSLIFENCEGLARVASSRAFFCGLPGTLSASRLKRALWDYAGFLLPELGALLLCVLLCVLLLRALLRRPRLMQ